MKNGLLKRFLVILASFSLAIGIEYLWLGKEAFQAFGLIIGGFFMAPIVLFFIFIEQKFYRNNK